MTDEPTRNQVEYIATLYGRTYSIADLPQSTLRLMLKQIKTKNEASAEIKSLLEKRCTSNPLVQAIINQQRTNNMEAIMHLRHGELKEAEVMAKKEVRLEGGKCS